MVRELFETESICILLTAETNAAPYLDAATLRSHGASGPANRTPGTGQHSKQDNITDKFSQQIVWQNRVKRNRPDLTLTATCYYGGPMKPERR